MARKNKKCSSITRRELLKSIVAGTAAVPLIPLTTSKAKAQDINESIDVAIWRKYSFTMALYVPRIYDNAKSLGSRKYQRQKIVGKIALGFSDDGDIVDVQFYDLINKTHKLSNGNNVIYDGILNQDACYPRFNAIGNNKTKIFKTASICFAMVAEPSYNIGEVDEDTSLYITLAGKGQLNAKGQLTRVNGYVVGTLGCGCTEYGHVSPTRTIGYYGATDQVTDVAAVYGNWSMKLNA